MKAVKVLAIITWCACLWGTNSTYYSYIVLALFGIYCLFKRNPEEVPKNVFIVNIILACVFTCINLMGNYYLLNDLSLVLNMLRVVLITLGGFVTFYEIFMFGYCNLRSGCIQTISYERSKKSLVFWGGAAGLFVFTMTYVVFCTYPGSVQYDTLRQLIEIQSNALTNHHPVVLSWLIKLGIQISNSLGLGITFGIFLSIIPQVVGTSLVVGYTMLTLYEIGVKRVYLIFVYLFFLFYPMNICFISYVQKDGPFAYCVLLFIVTTYRIIKKMGSHKALNIILMVIGGLGVCLLRSNGLAMIGCTLLFALLIKNTRKEKMLTFGMTGIVVATIFFRGIILPVTNVEPTEFCEGLSIPIQQIGRVVYEQLPLSKQEEDMVSALCDINSIRYTNPYDPHCSDHIKGTIQFGGKDNYLKEHKDEYLKLWCGLGLRYPKEYIEAYIDETSGYWLPGYGDCFYTHDKYELASCYGINQIIMIPTINGLINKYLSLFSVGGILHIFVENGLFVYGLFYIFIIALWKSNDTAILCVPGLAGVATLLISTPLFQNQRYTVFIFVCMIFIIYTVFRGGEKDEE